MFNPILLEHRSVAVLELDFLRTYPKGMCNPSWEIRRYVRSVRTTRVTGGYSEMDFRRVLSLQGHPRSLMFELDDKKQSAPPQKVVLDDFSVERSDVIIPSWKSSGPQAGPSCRDPDVKRWPFCVICHRGWHCRSLNCNLRTINPKGAISVLQ